MVKDFRGQVRIEDVKKEFDDLLDRINLMIDTYNYSADIGDIDYTKAGTTLAGSGYTLTVGGLKKVLKTYNNTILGCKPFKIASNQIKITDGIFISEQGCARIKGTTLTGSSSYLWYQPSSNTLSLSSSSGAIKVCDLNWNRGSNAIEDNLQIQCEELPFKTYKITSQSKKMSEEVNTARTTSKAEFVGGMNFRATEGQGWFTTKLFGVEVASNRQTGHRNLNYWSNFNWLLIPKAVANVFTYTGTAAQKVWNVIVTKS